MNKTSERLKEEMISGARNENVQIRGGKISKESLVFLLVKMENCKEGEWGSKTTLQVSEQVI